MGLESINFTFVIKEIHSFFAFIFLLSTIISIGYAIGGLIQKSNFTSTQFRLAQIAFITSHVQLLLGMLLWFLAGYFKLLSENPSMVMTTKSIRFIAIEHPIANIVGIILVSVGYFMMKRSRRLDQESKNLYILILFGLALALILSRIPWDQWIT